MNSLRLILSDRRYFAPAWVFASLNIMIGTWVLYLPHIKMKFGINDAEVGIALFCVALGLLISIPFVPFVNQKIGVGRSTQIGVIIFALAYNLPVIAPTYWTLCAGLFTAGFFSGFTDVSMNALVSTIESTEKKHFMSAAHGFFSLGGFIGAGLGSVAIGLFSNPSGHMFAVCCFIILTNLALSKYYSNIKEKATSKSEQKNILKNIRPLFGLSFVAFIIMMNEGAVEHWSNLFLFDMVKVSESKAGLGFIAFSLCMTIGRFLGDGISQKIGSIKIIAYGCVIAFAAYFLVITSNLFLAILGFGILGLGLSVIIPELFRLAGQMKGVPASVGISIVSGIGFSGFLLGPLLLGLISNQTSLTWSFAFLSVSVVLALGVTFFHSKRNNKHTIK